MDSNMTFRIDSEVKAQMHWACQLLLPLIFLPMPLFEQKACLLLSRFRSL